MIHPDLFVGSVAVVLGCVGIAAAALNWEHSYRLHKAQWMEARLGRAAVRVAYGLIGILLIVLGLAIAFGFGPNAQKNRGAILRQGKEKPSGALVAV